MTYLQFSPLLSFWIFMKETVALVNLRIYRMIYLIDITNSDKICD